MDQIKSFSTEPQRLEGIPLSDGLGEGILWHAHGGLPRMSSKQSLISDSMVSGELGRMRQAVQIVSLVMENSIHQVTHRLGKSYADMFTALREMLHDPTILEEIQWHIAIKHFEAGSAITTVLESYRKRLSEASSPYIRERSPDLLELEGSLLDALDSEDFIGDKAYSHCAHDVQGRVIAVVETLTPRLVLDLKNTNLGGIACEHAGPTSHAAILCRAFGIPAIAGIKRIHSYLPKNGYAVIDGAGGTIWSATQQQTLSELMHTGKKTEPAETVDLSKIVLMANLNLSQNAISAVAAGAQGIGLYRTEFEFMLDNRLLSRQEQFIRYRTVVIAMMGLPVTIRLLDISIDKSASVFDLLGKRTDPSSCGALFLLSQPQLLEAQAGAIAQAAQFGPVRVVYPMVADAKQFMQLKSAFRSAVGDKTSARFKHGAMIELPSAVDDATGILAEADFVCLGTNDLIKSVLHIHRDATIDHTAEIVNSPKLWEAIGRVALAANSFDKEVTVCGEMASNLSVLPRFIGLGIRIFSMNIHTIRLLKNGSE